MDLFFLDIYEDYADVNLSSADGPRSAALHIEENMLASFYLAIG